MINIVVKRSRIFILFCFIYLYIDAEDGSNTVVNLEKEIMSLRKAGGVPVFLILAVYISLYWFNCMCLF